MALDHLLANLERWMHLRGFRHLTVDVGGHRIAFHEYGRRRGPLSRDILLVHGLGSSSLAWARTMGALGRHHRVLAIDLPGFGSSPAPEDHGRISVKGLTESVLGFLETQGDGPTTIVGQSLGGWLAVKAAARRPERFDQVVLVNNAGVYYPEVDELSETLRLASREDVARFAARLWHRPPAAYRWFYNDFIRRMEAPGVVKFLASVGSDDFINDDLARLTMPTSIVWGANDRFLRRSNVDVMLGALPETRVFWIPNCGHIPQIERPREFNRILTRLLTASAAG